MNARQVVLCGDDRLSAAIERRLVLAGCSVRRLPPAANADVAGDSFDLAAVLVIAADDDPENVDLALTARRLRSDLPIVIRVFDHALAAHIRSTLGGVAILSVSALVAPAFFEATLSAMARRGSGAAPRQSQTSMAGARRLRRLDRVVVSAVAGFVAILVLFTLFFSTALQLSYVDSMYFVWTTVTTVGYGDIALRERSTLVKVVGMILMFSGAAFLAVLFGLFTDWVVGRRLDQLRGRVRVRGSGHIVIAGGGNIGTRVAQRLQESGQRVVIIERDADNKNVEALRSDGHHVILADAARADILQLANVEDSAAVLCLTDSDAVNFQIALLVRARSQDVPVVMRVVSPELSAHVSEHGDAVAISPIAIASEQFAAAALKASVTS